MIPGNYINDICCGFVLDIVLCGADIRIPLAELLCVIRNVSVSIMYSRPLQLLLRINDGPKDQAGVGTTMGPVRCPEAIKLVL